MEVLDVPPAAQAALVVAVNTKRQKTERHALTDPNLTPSMNKLFKRLSSRFQASHVGTSVPPLTAAQWSEQYSVDHEALLEEISRRAEVAPDSGDDSLVLRLLVRIRSLLGSSPAHRASGLSLFSKLMNVIVLMPPAIGDGGLNLLIHEFHELIEVIGLIPDVAPSAQLDVLVSLAADAVVHILRCLSTDGDEMVELYCNAATSWGLPSLLLGWLQRFVGRSEPAVVSSLALLQTLAHGYNTSAVVDSIRPGGAQAVINVLADACAKHECSEVIGESAVRMLQRLFWCERREVLERTGLEWCALHAVKGANASLSRGAAILAFHIALHDTSGQSAAFLRCVGIGRFMEAATSCAVNYSARSDSGEAVVDELTATGLETVTALLATVLLLLHFSSSVTSTIMANDPLGATSPAAAEKAKPVIRQVAEFVRYHKPDSLLSAVCAALLGVIASDVQFKSLVCTWPDAMESLLRATMLETENESLVELTCRVIAVVSRGQSSKISSTAFFGSARSRAPLPYAPNAVSLACRALGTFPGSVDTCSAAAALAWSIAYQNRQVQALARSTESPSDGVGGDMFWFLTEALNMHCGEVQLVTHACVALGNLSAGSRENQDRVGKVGAVEAVVRALRRHMSSSSVCFTCCSMLYFALNGHPLNGIIFRDNGGVALVEDIIEQHNSPQMTATCTTILDASTAILSQTAARAPAFSTMSERTMEIEILTRMLVNKWGFPAELELTQSIVDRLAAHVRAVSFEAGQRITARTVTSVDNGSEFDETISVHGWWLKCDGNFTALQEDGCETPGHGTGAVSSEDSLLMLDASTPTTLRCDAMESEDGMCAWLLEEAPLESILTEVLAARTDLLDALATLRTVPALTALSTFHLFLLGLTLEKCLFRVEKVLYDEDDVDDEGCFIVDAGHVELQWSFASCMVERTTTRIIKTRGQVFGMEGILQGCRRTARATVFPEISSRGLMSAGILFRLSLPRVQSAIAQYISAHVGIYGLPTMDSTRLYGTMNEGAWIRPYAGLRSLFLAATTKTEYLKAARDFCGKSGQPITVTTVLDGDKLNHVDLTQLRKDLDRETVVFNAPSHLSKMSPATPGDRLTQVDAELCKLILAAASKGIQLVNDSGSEHDRVSVTTKMNQKVAKSGADILAEEIKRLSMFMLQACDRTNSCGDAFFILQSIFFTELVSVTPVTTKSPSPIVFEWNGQDGVLSTITETVFQVTALDPQDNDCAWLKCSCSSVIYIDVLDHLSQLSQTIIRNQLLTSETQTLTKCASPGTRNVEPQIDPWDSPKPSGNIAVPVSGEQHGTVHVQHEPDPWDSPTTSRLAAPASESTVQSAGHAAGSITATTLRDTPPPELRGQPTSSPEPECDRAKESPSSSTRRLQIKHPGVQQSHVMLDFESAPAVKRVSDFVLVDSSKPEFGITNPTEDEDLIY